jgi:hypothetical protein
LLIKIWFLAAFSWMRLAVLTESPMAVYSRRFSVPIQPRTASPKGVDGSLVYTWFSSKG